VIGASWLLSSIGVIVRDVSHGLGLMLQLVPFVTPVFYPVDAMPPKLQVVLRFNPLTPIVENLRMTLLWQRMPNWGELGLWTAAATLVLIAGYSWFEYTRADFADVV
jgi:lipopolysaccharide transport system permease protein